MTIEDRINKIKQARILVREVLSVCGNPMVEGALGEADLNLHWVLWNLGEKVELHPQLEQ